MQSEHGENSSASRPMRVSAMRQENQEFKIAGEDFGGLRQKTQPGINKAATADEKGFTLPLGNWIERTLSAPDIVYMCSSSNPTFT